MPRAAGLAAEVTRRFGIEPELIKGKSGTFDVMLDGTQVFSKRETGRFPNPGEVEAAIASRIGPEAGAEGRTH